MLITAKVLALTLFAYLYFTPSGECSDKVTTAIGQGALFVTFVCTEAFRLVREARTRRWQREDAMELARKTETTAEDVKQTTKQVMEAHEEKVNAKLDEQTSQLQQSMRTRVEDFNKNIDALLPPNTPKRRGSDGK